MTIRPIVAGNWKMNGLLNSLDTFAAMDKRYSDNLKSVVDLMICPPSTLIHSMSSVGQNIEIGAQDCHLNEKGAHTGDLSAEMLVDAGARAIIVGHSERRADHGELDDVICRKALASARAGAVAIICVGESREQREGGKAINVVLDQLEGSVPDGANASGVIIAYEPIWAIGTGLIPTLDDVEEMHTAIRQSLVKRFAHDGEAMKILYGGSVKPGNAAELMAVKNVNGALVGGASLKTDDFIGIANAYLS